MSSSLRIPSGRIGWSFALLGGFILLGCEPIARDDDDAPPDYTKLVAVKGTVTIKGKAVPGVVVTFVPPKWAASNGETIADGSYELQTAGRPGALPGVYKVAISYLVSADGQAQGLAPRSAMSPPPGMATAREKIPVEFSDPGRTTLKATVSRDGGTFDFDVPVDLEGQSTKSSGESSQGFGAL